MEDDYAANKKAYDTLAGKWSQKYFNADVKRSMDLFVKYLKPGSKVLDIGCGPGRDTKELSSRGFNVTGVDFSEEMLKIAKTHFSGGNFMQMDMLDLKFPDNYFDGIWAMASFLNIKKKDSLSTLKGFFRVLNEDGILAMAVKKGDGEIHEAEDGETRLFSLYSESELNDFLKRAGFYVLEGSTEKVKPNVWIEVVSRAVK